MLRKKKFGGFTVAGVEKKEEKNWGAQILLAVAFGGFLFGGTFAFAAGAATTAGHIAIVVCILSGVGMVVGAVRAIRTWDY